MYEKYTVEICNTVEISNMGHGRTNNYLFIIILNRKVIYDLIQMYARNSIYTNESY